MKGIDIVIEKQRLAFSDHLWTGNTSFWAGRCFRNYRQGDQIPEVISSGNEYKDVLLNDTKDVVCFFDVLPERTDSEATVDIYFAVNLKKLYPLITERATEYALYDVLQWIRRGGTFTVDKITDGYESWKEWGMVKKEDNMQPYYLFKIRTNVKYVLTC